jgi:hypothetical protein
MRDRVTILIASASHRRPVSTGQSSGNDTPIVRLKAVVARCARSLWRSQVAPELALRAGVSVSAAEKYLAGDRAINGNALARLLLGPDGPEFLNALVSSLPPAEQRRWREELWASDLRAHLDLRLEDLHRALADRFGDRDGD